jgi:putative salt-induced outer membrane protein
VHTPPTYHARTSLRTCSGKTFFAFVSSPFLAALVLLALTTTAHADSITLKNGDHLTGGVTQLAGGKLTVHTSYAGDITIAFDQISTVKVDKPVVLSLESRHGKKVEVRKVEITAIDRTGAGFSVTTTSGPESFPTAAITTVRTPAAQQAFEDSLHPGWLHAWTGTANISFALAKGNSDTTTLGTGINLARPTLTDKTSLYFNDIYTHDGIADATTAEHTNAGARYDHNVNPKLFAFGTGDFAIDALQHLDLRTVAGGGLGWHAVAKPRQQFDILGGLVWTHESYGAFETVNATPPPPTILTPALTHSFAALDFGQQYSRKLGAASSFTEQAYIFPDLNDTSQYRVTFNSAINTKLNSFLSWQTTISDVYVTNPPSSTKSNDFILTTGLGFTFIRK